MSYVSSPKLLNRFRLNLVLGSTLKLSSKFNFGWSWSHIHSTLCEVQLECYRSSRRRLIIQNEVARGPFENFVDWRQCAAVVVVEVT
jgi:hypothetical protein